jgi:hypothetical protein
VSLRTSLAAGILAALLGGSARADGPLLRLDSLSVHEQPQSQSRVALQVAPLDESSHLERTALLLTLRAQQMTSPHGNAPSVLPQFSTTSIGVSLKLRF